MKVSVIIPSFNHAEHIRQCLESVARNKIQDMEVIICDDASLDESDKIIKQWIKEQSGENYKIRYISHLSNQGITSTLNELISECRGEIISPLASDDFYLDGIVMERVKFLMSNPNLLGGFNDGIGVGANNIPSLLKQGSMRYENLIGKKFKNEVIFHWSEPANLQFWRRTAFRSHGGQCEFDKNSFTEDIHFALHALSQDRFGYLNYNGYAYRYRNSSILEKEDYRRKWLEMAFIYGNHANGFSGEIRDHILSRSEYYYSLSINCSDKIKISEKRFKKTIEEYNAGRGTLWLKRFKI
jgi:glycosyltransferase involved in cell wall biosynthesis